MYKLSPDSREHPNDPPFRPPKHPHSPRVPTPEIPQTSTGLRRRRSSRTTRVSPGAIEAHPTTTPLRASGFSAQHPGARPKQGAATLATLLDRRAEAPLLSRAMRRATIADPYWCSSPPLRPTLRTGMGQIARADQLAIVKPSASRPRSRSRRRSAPATGRYKLMAPSWPTAAVRGQRVVCPRKRTSHRRYGQARTLRRRADACLVCMIASTAASRGASSSSSIT